MTRGLGSDISARRLWLKCVLSSQELQKLTLLLNIPPPGRAQCLSLSSALEGVVAEVGLNAQDLKQRQSILALVEEVLRPVLPGV